MNTQVVNIYSLGSGWYLNPDYVYIGRAGHGFDGYFGNPIRLNPGEPRGATIERFRAYMLNRMQRDPEYTERIASLAGKTLVCFCKPHACHGDVLAAMADTLTIRGEER